MQTLSYNDYKLFEQLVGMKQSQMHRAMYKLLNSYYDDMITTDDYIVAFGNIPIALVAHMDTVFQTPVVDLYYDKIKNVFWSPDGLGSDDRAGIFAILQILKAGLRPSIILTTDEESGGIGAAALALDHPKCPIENLKYMIELDRRGNYDAVFYDCETKDFKSYIESFGFLEAIGSFSDISFLMPEWKICGVNLSIGYENEHTYTEILNMNHLFVTVEKVKKMLQVEEIPSFEYEEKELGYINFWKDAKFSTKCHKCGEEFTEYEVIPVKDKDGVTKFYCTDCVCNNVFWCSMCGEAVEAEYLGQEGMCKDCLEVLSHGID